MINILSLSECANVKMSKNDTTNNVHQKVEIGRY